MDKLVSVIIPTYNRGNIITKSIESVLNQTYKNIEIIIADDCSSDNTEEVVNGIGDERIKYVRLSENSGAGGARNYGVNAASGELIAFHDSDDICMPDRIEKQIKYLECNKEYDLVYSSYKIQYAEAESVFPLNYSMEELEGYIYPRLLIRNTVGCPTILMKKDGFLEIGGFDESYRFLEDWEFIIRYAKNHQIGYIDEPLITAISLNGGLSSDVVNHYKTRARMIAESKEELDRLNLFNQAVMVVFSSAEKNGYLDFAKNCIMKELMERSIY